MTRRAWISIVVVLALILIGALSRIYLSDHREKGASIKVGVVLPLTGDAAVYGKALKNGIDLAESEDKSLTSLRISLVFEDDQGQATKAVSATQRLVSIENVPVIIGGAMSSTAEAMIPICDAARVVLVSPTATKPSLTKKGGYFLRLWPSDNYDGKVMAEAAYDKLGLRRVSIIYINVAYGVGITEVFTREFTRLGGTIVSTDGYSQGATDFRTLLTKLKSNEPEGVYLPGYVAEVTQLLRQARDLGVKTRFLRVNSLYDPKLIEIAGAAAEGAVFTYPTFDPRSENPVIARFVAAYKAKYGSDPDAFSAQGYDSYRVLRRALDRLGQSGLNGAILRESFHQLGPFEGPGGTFTFDSRGDVEKPLRLLTVRNGRFVPFGS